jgi:hypothetical protein
LFSPGGIFTTLPEAHTTIADIDATLIPAASETMPVASSGFPTMISPDQFSLTGPMERIPVFPSVWPTAPVIGKTAIQNAIAIPDAGDAGPVASSSEPQCQPGNSKPHRSESTPGNYHVHSEAGSSTGNFSVQHWDPELRYGVVGGKKRRKVMPTTGV